MGTVYLSVFREELVLGMTIAKRLKEYRKKQHLTVIEIANILMIPVRTFGSYERGEVLPGTKFYIKMLDKFNVNLNWLIAGRGNMLLD